MKIILDGMLGDMQCRSDYDKIALHIRINLLSNVKYTIIVVRYFRATGQLQFTKMTEGPLITPDKSFPHYIV